MAQVDETTRNTLDVLAYIQQLVHDVDRLRENKDEKEAANNEDIVPGQ